MKSNYYVYSYLRSVSSPNGAVGTPYYIGKGCGNRAYCKQRTYKQPNREFIKIIADNLSEADAFQVEILLIYLYGRISDSSGCLRNVTSGGEGTSGTKRPHSAETKKKISLSNIGKRRSEEQKAKNLSCYHRGKDHHLFGIGHTKEARKKIKEARGRQTISEYHLSKLKESAKGSIWIHNEDRSFRIKQDDLSLYEGFSLGRKTFKRSRRRSS